MVSRAPVLGLCFVIVNIPISGLGSSQCVYVVTLDGRLNAGFAAGAVFVLAVGVGWLMYVCM